MRDAIVLELPLSPLCEDGCQGLCVECGVRLADAEPGHRHEQRGTPWAALKDFRAEQPDGDQPASGPAEQGSTGRECRAGDDDTPGGCRAGSAEGAVTWQYPSARCPAATPGRGGRSGRRRRRSSWPARTAASRSFRTSPARHAAPTTGVRSRHLPDKRLPHGHEYSEALRTRGAAGGALREGKGW